MSTNNNQELWQAVRDSGHANTITIANQLQASQGDIRVLATFCPLYAPGDLQESQLLPAPADINESRVAGKWAALQNTLGVMASAAHTQGREVTVIAVFANKGVLLGTEPTDTDEVYLKHHKELYAQAIGGFCTKHSLLHVFEDYDSLEVPFQRFVKPTQTIADFPEATIHVEDEEMRKVQETAEWQLATKLNHLMTELGVPTQINPNRATRQKIGALIKAFGEETTFWLVAGYLAFDHKIPGLTGADGVYVSTERFAPIFRIANLTPGLRDMARVEISA